jgi:hypothetical protein
MIKEQTLRNLISLAKEYAEFVKKNFENHEPKLITLNDLVQNSSKNYKNRIRIYQQKENVAVNFGNFTEFDYQTWDNKISFMESLSDAEFNEIYNEAYHFFFTELPSIIEKQKQVNTDNLQDLIEKKQKELDELQKQLNK